MFAFLLQAGLSELQWFSSLGVGGVLGGLALVFYRQDRKASEKRYSTLSEGFREIVQENTKAITLLTNTMTRGIVNCPLKEETRRG